MATLENMLGEIPQKLPTELFQTLLHGENVRIERIISRGHASPEGLWYDQPRNEWVLVIQGEARLRLEGEEPVELKAGAFLNIPAHRRHRVEWTAPDRPTIWLAVHYC